ncbi:MAG: hypothetical protein HPY65_14310 [Syntrophaceae bacterium]|nr:hypothetical protein [Syntrophaceae bacterium]
MKGRIALCVLLAMLLFASVAAASQESSSIFKVGGDVTIEAGTKAKRVVSFGGQVTVNGVVETDVVAVGASVVLGKNAVVDGDVVSLGGTIVKGRGAVIRGNITEINASNFWTVVSSAIEDEAEGWSWVWAVISLAIFFCILIIAMLVTILVPKPIAVISATIREETLRSSLWGLLALILAVPLAILLAISVIGIVLIPLEVVIMTLAALAGFIAMSKLIGQQVYALARKQNQGIVRETFWGLIILWFAGWIPYVGPILKVLAVVLGLGGVIFSRFGTRTKGLPLQPPPVDQPPAEPPPAVA